jgi:hypothetical protein
MGLMDLDKLPVEAWRNAQEILGYLNFSSGNSDPRFLGNLNLLFGQIEAQQPRRRGRGRAAAKEPTWKILGRFLETAMERLERDTEAFRHVDQARAVVRLVFEVALPAYREHHRDLLFHQTEEALFQPFFIGRMFEVVLRQGAPWEESDRIVRSALERLNDYIGHRPVAVLRSEQKLQPYAHEWVRPIPLYIQDAGIAVGRYHDLIEKALEILSETDPAILSQAWFNPQWLEELAIDPRAYDFDHPVNKRPNYHFGQWDPNHIDNSGRYRRFVVPQVTIDAILSRLEKPGKIAAGQLLHEAGSVLVGIMLMGSGISGSGPGTHDSTTSLTTLLPHIASYRDAFYEWLIERIRPPHAKRLRAEAVSLRQPFGGARQHLNQTLAKHRAMQLQHSHVAQLYAWMGYTDEALRHSEIVPVASARMSCQIYCRLTSAHLAADCGDLAAAAAALPDAEDLLHRAIECGAFVDPWNILGFGAQFSLFMAVENSVHDHRVDELIATVSQIFGLYTRLQKETAAVGDSELTSRLSQGMKNLAEWWDKFATTEVGDVEGFSGQEAWESAAHVADVLKEWHAAGTAAGDVAFWRAHVDRFRSPKAYALVVDSLLEQHDLVAAMGLLIQWLSQGGEIPLVEQEFSFHDLATEWMDDLLGGDEQAEEKPAEQRGATEARRWSLARKLFDYMEANAEQYWHVPHLELGAPTTRKSGESVAQEGEAEAIEEEDPSAGLYAAAYEDVVFRDSANDGFEGEMMQGGQPQTDFEFTAEADRLGDRLHFLSTLARLWKMAATTLGTAGVKGDRDAVLGGWLNQATSNQQELSELLTAVHRYRIPVPRGSHDSMVEFDQRRTIKEHLLEQIIATCVETADASRSIRAAMEDQVSASYPQGWEEPAQRVLRAVFRGDAKGARAAMPDVLSALAQQPLLYVALARGGSPLQIVASRSIQRVLRRLLAYLPRLGLLEETYRLIGTIHDMERNHAVGPGAITEFDQMFEIGCKGIAQCLTISSETWHGQRPLAPALEDAADIDLIAYLERTVESLLQCWLDHSRRVRLSVLETVTEESRWRALRKFIEQYGHDLFTQKFMNLGNLRAILHQGVDAYLQYLEEEPEEEGEIRLVADLKGPLDREEAIHWLEMILEAIVENYSEYIDYNSTTTQSDRGEMLYTLLDFLRLQASYNRVAWNLRPVILAHEVLVRAGRDYAAEIWRQAVVERTADIAREHLKRFQQLSRQYGMRLPSVAERLSEQFVRPLTIDRLRALIEPAIEELRADGQTPSFEALRESIDDLTEEPAGVGFEVPRWLESLEDEMEEIRSGSTEDEQPVDPNLPVPEVRLSMKEARRQIQRMADG